MKVKFNHPRAIDGKLFTPGVHELDEKMKANWFFQALEKNGDLTILDVIEKIVSDVVDIVHQVEDIIHPSANAEPSVPAAPVKEKKSKGK